MKKTKIEIVWFKRDLRTSDHEPLFQASLTDFPILPLYIIEPNQWSQPFMSLRHWHFLNDCLYDLRKQCNDLGQPLVIKIGSATNIFSELNSNYSIQHIWAHEETGHKWSYERDTAVRKWCRIVQYAQACQVKHALTDQCYGSQET